MALTKISRSLLDTGVSDNSDATAITIDSSERVGIGETSPLGKIHAKVSDTSASASAQGNLLVLEDTENGLSILSGTSGAGYINFGDSDDNDIGMIIYDHSANAMRFWSNAAERMRIGSAGQVMINTTSSGNRALNVTQLIDGETGLYVNNTSATVTSSFAPLAQLQFSGDADVGDGTKYIEFQRQSDTIGSITALGAAVQYNTSSDRNLKENIVDASSQLNLIKNLQVREFDWKTDSRHDVGLIAQELHEHIPNVVTVGSDEKNAQGFTTPWSIDYGKLTPYLVKAIQEQQELIETQQTTINDLKSRIETLES